MEYDKTVKFPWGGTNLSEFAIEHKGKRLTNIDTLRTLCSVFVIFEHFCETTAHNAFGFSLESSIAAHIVLRLLYGVARFAVPCFFMISGYLSIESKSQKYGKVVGLFSMFFLYSIIPALSSCCIQIVKGTFDFQDLKEIIFNILPRNYYLYLFAAVYLLSPFINQAVLRLTQKQYLRVLIILFMLFSAWSTLINTYKGVKELDELNGVYFTSRTGTSMGFNFMNFSMLYMIGGYIKLHYNPNIKRDRKIEILIVLLSTVSTTVLKMALPQFSKAVLYYDSIFITLGATAFFLLFVTIDNKGGRFYSYTGRQTFGVYLIHGFASGLIEHFITIESVVSKGLGGTILGILIFVFGTYCLSILIVSIISILFKPLNKWCKKTLLYNIMIYNEKC